MFYPNLRNAFFSFLFSVILRHIIKFDSIANIESYFSSNSLLFAPFLSYFM